MTWFTLHVETHNTCICSGSTGRIFPKLVVQVTSHKSRPEDIDKPNFTDNQSVTYWLNWTCSNLPQTCRAWHKSWPEYIDTHNFTQSKRHLLAKENLRYVTNSKTSDWQDCVLGRAGRRPASAADWHRWARTRSSRLAALIIIHHHQYYSHQTGLRVRHAWDKVSSKENIIVAVHFKSWRAYQTDA